MKRGLLFQLGVCVGVLIISANAFAQEGPRRVKAGVTKQRFRQVNVGYQMWQEKIDVSSNGTESQMLTHMHGVRIGIASHRPSNSSVRWVTVYGADLGLGLAKGAAKPPLTDEVESQGWLSVTVYPGLIYRTTSKSELGILLPVTYRNIQWKVDEPFEADRSSSFSAGVTGIYVNRFTLRDSMYVTLSHQAVWGATVWGLGYQVDFR